MRTLIKIEIFAMHEKARPKYSAKCSEPFGVSRLIGFDYDTGEFRKVYLHGYLDYSNANSRGSRGIYKLFFVDDGIYEVFEQTSWKKIWQYYLLVADGKKTQMTLEEAIAWLEANTKS